ncbi:MAG: FHA domain-containing protein [Ruminococcus sp.]
METLYEIFAEHHSILHFCSGDDTSYIKEYITILNSGINFSEFELEEYIKRLMGQKSENSKEIECPVCHTILSKGTSYCIHCGSRVTGNTGRTENGIYDPLKQNEKIDKEDNSIREKSKTRKDNTQGLSDGTTVLGTNPGETTVLGSEELETPNYPYLIRCKNDEKIMVNKPIFRIGKEKKYCDYFVVDNNAVSRSHADIITKEKRYYIIDLNSTNKTYVDGRAIAIEKEVEIFNGTKLRLANEDFVFYIDDMKGGK